MTKLKQNSLEYKILKGLRAWCPIKMRGIIMFDKVADESEKSIHNALGHLIKLRLVTMDNRGAYLLTSEGRGIFKEEDNYNKNINELSEKHFVSYGEGRHGVDWNIMQSWVNNAPKGVKITISESYSPSVYIQLGRGLSIDSFIELGKMLEDGVYWNEVEAAHYNNNPQLSAL